MPHITATYVSYRYGGCPKTATIMHYVVVVEINCGVLLLILWLLLLLLIW